MAGQAENRQIPFAQPFFGHFWTLPFWGLPAIAPAISRPFWFWAQFPIPILASQVSMLHHNEACNLRVLAEDPIMVNFQKWWEEGARGSFKPRKEKVSKESIAPQEPWDVPSAAKLLRK